MPQVASPIVFNSSSPNFARDEFATLAAMKACTVCNEGHVSFCKATGKKYEFREANNIDPTTGKWREVVVDPAKIPVSIQGLSATDVQAALEELLGLRDAGQWYCGTAVTADEQTESSSAYKVGDLYLNTSTGNVYQLAMANDVKKWGEKVNIACRVALTTTTINRETEIVDGYSHAYLDITNGGVQTLGTDDLMAPANAVLGAITKILHPEQQQLLGGNNE